MDEVYLCNTDNRFDTLGILGCFELRTTQNEMQQIRSSADQRENINRKKTIWMNTANMILGVGVVLTLLGAMYIAIVQQGHAIAACFVLASALMGSLLISCIKK